MCSISQVCHRGSTCRASPCAGTAGAGTGVLSSARPATAASVSTSAAVGILRIIAPTLRPAIRRINDSTAPAAWRCLQQCRRTRGGKSGSDLVGGCLAETCSRGLRKGRRPEECRPWSRARPGALPRLRAVIWHSCTAKYLVPYACGRNGGLRSMQHPHDFGC